MPGQQGGSAAAPPSMAQAVPSREQVYIHLTSRAISAEREVDLAFIIVNETMALLPYRQAAMFQSQANGRLALTQASGLASVEDTSPYTVWLNRFSRQFHADEAFSRFDFDSAAQADVESWQEWLPDHLVVVPMQATDGRSMAFVLFARDKPWTDSDCSQLAHLHRVYAYCLNSIQTRKASWGRVGRAIRSRWVVLGAVATLVAVMFIPVKLTTLASAEVIALNAFSVASPQDGVVQTIAIQPNAPVKTGDLLFTLDDTTVLNRYEVAAKGLAIARAEMLVAEQRAFDDPRGKAAVAASQGRVREKQAELASIKSLMARVEVRATRDGVAIFSDANDWIGRPVQTGERVMQIADPNDAGLLMWLPVKDALNLEPGAEVKLFLHTKALTPVSARLVQTSYQSVPSPENVASYKLKGTFDDPSQLPRIGLRGTARIAGEWSNLGYYLFRRPLAALREWTGL